MASSERFRSFAERYVIARAAFFRPGHEEEDAWAAVATAKSIYRIAASMSKTAELDPDASDQQLAGQLMGRPVQQIPMGTPGALAGPAHPIANAPVVVRQGFTREQQRIMDKKDGWFS